jgi:serine protease AprX
MTTTSRLHARGAQLLLSFAALTAIAVLGAPAASASAGDGVRWNGRGDGVRWNAAGAAQVKVIVRERPSAGCKPERLVRRLGGTVVVQLPIVNGFAAVVPSSAIPALEASALVHSVTADAPVTLSSVDGHDNAADQSSLLNVARAVGADDYWAEGATGKGVDVALIDSGVLPVEGLRTAGKVVNGPDLSFEASAENLRYLDTYGHGTHLAGIIAGRDGEIPERIQPGEERFAGIAPDARIVSVKVADANGATDVSQVIAAIDWVVQNRNRNGLNIRVLNLSFGTDGRQDYRLDPLTYAAEVAWRKGIAVVVAAGNDGFLSRGLSNPAYDPYVIAVGGEGGSVLPDWSSWGDGKRNPDLVAPGRSIVSLRAPGSTIDRESPRARVGDTPRFFRGSGSSQAAAVVSGAAALVIQRHPSITPDQLKAVLAKWARKLPATISRGQGAGMLELRVVPDRKIQPAQQAWPLATGTGSLELARGSGRVDDGKAELAGEQDIFGTPWDGVRWSTAALAEQTWAGGVWNGVRWSGDGWQGADWLGVRWSGVRWSGVRWSNDSWAGVRWSGDSWSGVRWSGVRWSGVRWSGVRWSGAGWGD